MESPASLFINWAEPGGRLPLGKPSVSQFLVLGTVISQTRSYNTTAEQDEKILGSTLAGAAYLLRDGRDAFAWMTAQTNSRIVGYPETIPFARRNLWLEPQNWRIVPEKSSYP